ncbi:MAG TPA: aminotransferase class I/II-fold pyridoxal phosphate-dependent enzyme [Longimicrobium sp.]|nr:aminotransferase class I/II-fold pyridoxal phosphate-dependent enzyme [Longimicrobium sp.]
MPTRDQFTSPLYTHFVSDYAQPTGPDLLGRTDAFFEWQDARRNAGLWPYSRSLDAAPRPACGVHTETGTGATGLNFLSQDYLSLSTHPDVVEAAHRTLRDHGLHSAGSGMLGGNSSLSLTLENALAEALDTPYVALFSTGWGAGFGTITALVKPDDYVVMDSLSHACLQTGAAAATKNVIRFRHRDNEAVRRHLRKIRARDTQNAILVVTEGLFSMDSDVPAIEELQLICREWGATLLVDVAHDFGAMGPRGTGSVGAQGMLGKVDLVMGAFSKTFASNGGFLATRSAAVRQFVRVFGGPHIFSNAMSPVSAAVVAEALRIVRSGEGDRMRAALGANIAVLRGELDRRGVEALGVPSPVVPVVVGDAPVARVAAKMIFERGVFVNLVEYPAVPIRGSRLRMQVMAGHSQEQARAAAAVVAGAIHEARAMVDGEFSIPFRGLEEAARTAPAEAAA